ncbi:hypothetical protein ABEB36_002974 [Hypothenemus hampei]|uniref:ZAD domain-containing protein n=1 Tax=Hypothenemus hampei TaxID=57062 RepID=A0ABD1F7K9_HYPHA
MEGADVQNVCRLCPENGTKYTLHDVFGNTTEKNLKEIILTTTGIEISDSDIISKKICKKCYENVQNIYETRQIAQRQNQHLKEVCQKYLSEKGIRLPNTCIIIKKDINASCDGENSQNAEIVTENIKNDTTEYRKLRESNSQPQTKMLKTMKKRIKGITTIHPTVIDLYKKYPKCKLTKKCLDKHIAPIISLGMGEVEAYFQKRNLNMSKFNWVRSKRVARKRTAVPHKPNFRFEVVELSKNAESKSRANRFLPEGCSMYSAIPISSVIENENPNKTSYKKLFLKDSIKSSADTHTQKGKFKESSDNLMKQKTKKVNESEEPDLSLPSTSKPEFIKSLGLAPATSYMDSRTLTCTICNSKHENIHALKKHSSRHRICPYCKIKFRTIETKLNHIKFNCHVKQMIKTPGTISLEKVDFNSGIREKYKDTFSELRDDSELDNIIVLTDGDESDVCMTDIDKVNEANVVSESTFKPIIDICDSNILNDLDNNLSHKDLIKKLVLINHKKNTAVGAAQTIIPQLKNPHNISEESCNFVDFKGHLLNHMVPVAFKLGNFNVSCPIIEKSEGGEHEHTTWKEVELLTEQAPPVPTDVPVVNASYPLTFVTSQVQSVSSIQVMATTPTMSIFLPSTSTFIPNSGVSVQSGLPNQTQTLNNTFFGPLTNASIQTGSLLQNYTLTSVPIVNNQMQMPSGAVATSSVVAAPSTVATTASTSTDNNSSLPNTSNRRVRTVVKKGRKIVLSPRSLNNGSKRKRPIIKVKIGNLTASKAPKPSKLRVKNIWELK